MHLKTTVLLALTSLLSTACATPEPRREGPLPALHTALSDRLADTAADEALVVAHRGSSATHPENTLPAFQAGIDDGADMVELDFRQTSDGVLVCMHDKSIDRTTDGAQRFGRDGTVVGAKTAGELGELDAGSWKGPEHAGVRVPTLSAALDLIQEGAVTMIEHKDGDPAVLVALLREKELVDDVLVQSFDWNWLAEVRALAPRLTLAALGHRQLTAERLDQIDALGVSMVHWSHEDLTLDDLRALQDRGYLVSVYTVDSDLGLLGCLEGGLDAITTDLPARLRALQRGRR